MTSSNLRDELPFLGSQLTLSSFIAKHKNRVGIKIKDLSSIQLVNYSLIVECLVIEAQFKELTLNCPLFKWWLVYATGPFLRPPFDYQTTV